MSMTHKKWNTPRNSKSPELQTSGGSEFRGPWGSFILCLCFTAEKLTPRGADSLGKITTHVNDRARGRMRSWVPGQGDRSHLLEFCEYRRTEDLVRLVFSSSGISRMYKWRTGLVRMESSSNGAGRSKCWALRVTGGFPPRGSHQHLGAGTSVTMGPARCFMGADALTAATLQLPQTPESAWPRRLWGVHGHSVVNPLLCCVPRP